MNKTKQEKRKFVEDYIGIGKGNYIEKWADEEDFSKIDLEEFGKPRYDCDHKCYTDEDFHAVSDAINVLMIFNKSCVNEKRDKIVVWIENNEHTAVKRIILEMK